MKPAVKELLAEIVDYAGLFPPAKLAFEKVVRNYAAYLESQASWMLGRLILPIGQLGTIAAIGDQRMPRREDGRAWQISCLLPSANSDDLAAAFQDIHQFNIRGRQSAGHAAIVDAVELKAKNADDVANVAQAISPDIKAYLELPYLQDEYVELIPNVAAAGDQLRAKIRTGGVVAELIPDAAVVLDFIRLCATHSVPFKATAGLHHPVRAVYPLTYEQHPECETMHGFLNVLLAGTVLYHNPQQTDLAQQILMCEDPGRFVANDQSWRFDEHPIELNAVRRFRDQGMVSYGSCSFIEPTEELIELGYALDEIT